MTTAAATTTIGFDSRVSESPLSALRFQIASRAADLREAGEEVERQLLDTAARRANLMQHLRQNEDARRQVLGALGQSSPREVVRAFHDGLALTSEMGLLDEQVTALKRRLAELSGERSLLAQVGEALGRIIGDGGIDFDQRAARLTQAVRHIFQFVEDDHEATAHAILDGPMQRLSDAAFDAELVGRALGRDLDAATQAAQRCREATVAAASGLQRRIARMSPISRKQSLAQALGDLLRDAPTREIARLRVIGMERRLPLIIELSAYRIVEEAVDNAVRHGHAAHIDVVISYQQDRVVIVVKDDGDGFDLVATEARMGRTRALGLIEMQERAALARGRCEVRSIIGAGSEVRITLPGSR